MKSTLTKITAFILTLCFVVTSTVFVPPPKKAEAEGKALACIAGYLTAALAALPSIFEDVVGVQNAKAGQTVAKVTDSGANNAISFNECVLKPLAKVMIITLIRNIGASIVAWVNTGFEGKPSFVTDFGGTLLDTADEIVGKFIEGSELGFLCNSFSFQIRIALALKYAQPFREKARCTLTSISKNVNSFANSNGGVGWDNWLRVTTEPQNNIYGAYVIADSELARRAAQAVGIKKDRIAIGEGFLDFETCDEYETPAEVNTRMTTGSNLGGNVTTSSSNGNPGFSTNLDPINTSLGGANSVLQNRTVAPNLSLNSATTFGGNIGQTAPNLSFSQTVNNTNTSLSKSISSKPICKRKSTKTPGKIISNKLSSVLGQSEIQQAVASEIDDVIAATMNQLAQKMIQGTNGLLGLSQKKNTNKQSFLQQYQSQYYNVNTTTNIDAGATSDIEDYTIKNYEDAASLIEKDPLIQDVYNSTAASSNVALAENKTRQEVINSTFSGEQSNEQNLAIYKPTSQISLGEGSSDKATNGVRDGDVTQFNKVTATGENANPWWEVDLEASKEIKEVRIWRVTSKPSGAIHPADKTLETIRLTASNEGGKDIWSSPYVQQSASTPNPLVIPVDKTVQYIRIEKRGTLDTQCRLIPAGYRGDTDEYESCYHPLELAEVEVIGIINTPTTTGLNGIATSTRTTSGSTSTQVVSNTQKTITLTASSTSPLTFSSIRPFSYDIQISANHSTSSLVISNSFMRNGVEVRIGNLFSSLTVKTQRGSGSIATNNISTNSGAITGNNVSVSSTEKFVFGFSGTKQADIPLGAYTIETTLSTVSGETVATKITDFVVQ